jgi:hypothetical protein
MAVQACNRELDKVFEMIRKRIRSVYRRIPRFRRKGAYRFHFIHIPKNGGNSVRAALQRRRDVSLSRPMHFRYVDIADEVGRDLKFFCIVRNPWSRTASRFVFAKQNCRKWPEKDPRKEYIQQASFADFVRDRKIFEIPEHPGQPWMGPMNSWFDHLEWIRDERGEVVCDCLRLEFLTEDISTYFGESIDLPHRNATKTKYDYRSMYDDDLAEIVANEFREDIEYFGFSFDSAATRGFIGA